jgi:hypothetical protein
VTKNAGADNTKADEVRRAYAARPLSQLLPAVTRAAYKRRSPAAASLMADWANIVGARLASETAPRRLSGTQLTIACSGPMAMELAHLAPVLIERINTASGRRVVERLRFVQDFTASPPAASSLRETVAPVPIEDLPAGELNDALARLRAAIRERRG